MKKRGMDCCVFLQVEFQWEFDLWGRTTVMIGGSGRHDTEKASDRTRFAGVSCSVGMVGF